MYKIFQKVNVNICILIILPVLFYLGIEFLVHYNTHSICIFKLITGHNCPGCGMTRAFSALFQLKLHRAFELNPRIIIVAPLLIYIWIATLIREIKIKYKNS